VEQKLIHHLMLTASFHKDIGLFHGQIGIAVFFYHYSKHTNNLVYADFADDLLDNIWEKMHNRLPDTFSSGLTGIAWGIEYLIQNHFVAGNSNDVCEEIDVRIMSLDPRRMNPEFIEKELEGFLHYVLMRTIGSVKQSGGLPFDEIYRHDLLQVFMDLREQEKINETSRTLISQYLAFVSGKEAFNYQFDLLSFINESEINEKNILSSPLGLKTGLAGKLYKQIISQSQ
jgi:lantibiotic modifying enzyme